MGLLRRSKPGSLSSKSVSLQQQQLKPDNPELDDAIAKRQDDAADAPPATGAVAQQEQNVALLAWSRTTFCWSRTLFDWSRGRKLQGPLIPTNCH